MDAAKPDTDADWGKWLDRLLALAPRPRWRRVVDWSAHRLDGTPFPPDYRAVVDAYGTVMFSGGPGSEGHVSVWSPLNPDGHRPSRPPADHVWGAPGLGQAVGVSWSADDVAWSGAVPSAPFAAIAWGGLSSSRSRVLPWVYWTPPLQDGRRMIAVRSSRGPDAWLLAMSVPEFLVRVALGATGCPWLPRDPEPEPLEVRTPETPDDDPTIPTEGWVQEPDRTRASSPGATWDDVPDVAIDVLRPDRMPGRGLRTRPAPDLPGERPALAELCARFPPPTKPLEVGSWADVDRMLGRRLPDDLRELVETYGAGSFAQAGGLEYDPPLHLFPASQIVSHGQEVLETLDMHDLNDLLGTETTERLRVAPFAVRGGGLGELWLWVVDDEHGVAVADTDTDYHVWPLPGRAADVVLELLEQREWFELDAIEPPPTVFIPSEYGVNGQAAP